MMEDNINALTQAIAEQAVKDWRRAVKKLRKNPDDKDQLARKRECEQFFRSEWFTYLTDLDGRYVLMKLKQEEM